MQDFEGSHLVYVAAGLDPFDVITNAVKYVLLFSFMDSIHSVSCLRICYNYRVVLRTKYVNGEKGVLSEEMP